MPAETTIQAIARALAKQLPEHEDDIAEALRRGVKAGEISLGDAS
jgi:hypothetical protein